MEVAQSIARKEGEVGKALAAVCDADADLAREEMKDEDAVSEEQAGSEGNASADFGSGTVKHGEGRSEDAVTSDLASNGSGDNDSNDEGDEQKTNVQDHDERVFSSTEAGKTLYEHEHHDDPTASLSASEMSQDRSLTSTESSQNNPNTMATSAEAIELPQKQSHNSTAYSTTINSPQDIPNPDATSTKLSQGQLDSPYVNAAASDSSNELHSSSGSSSGTSSSSEDCADPEIQTSTSAQDESCSDPETSDSLQVVFNDADLQPSSTQMPQTAQTQPQDDIIQAPEDDTAQASTKGGDFQPPSRPLPLTINYEALKHIATYFLPVSHGACIDTRSIEGGTFHEVEVLTFADGWTCIGRFAREEERLYKVESELATMEYVRTHTQIPVPEVYFVNHNSNHVVGAAFVLMERMEGSRLNDIWYELTTEHQLSVLEQLAQMLEQLAGLHFDQIGSLTAGGKVGPLVNLTRNLHEPLSGPFTSTLDFFLTGVENDVLRDGSEDTKSLWPTIEVELRALFAREASNPTLNPPYRLIHDDLEFFNILVTHDDKDMPPKITAIIDWDWAYTGPLHYLCEYPPPTIGYAGDEDEKPKEKLLRKHFVKALMQRYPKGSADRENVKRCFREKSVELRSFIPMFTNYNSEKIAPFSSLAKDYLSNLQRNDELDDYHPYGICEEWVPDSEPESDDD